MSSMVGPAACPPGRLLMVASTMPQVARWGDGNDESVSDSVGPVRGVSAGQRRPVGRPCGGAGDAPCSVRCAALHPRPAGVGRSHRRKRNVTHQRAGGAGLPAHQAATRPGGDHAAVAPLCR